MAIENDSQLVAALTKSAIELQYSPPQSTAYVMAQAAFRDTMTK
jgi:hypothetical protein